MNRASCLALPARTIKRTFSGRRIIPGEVYRCKCCGAVNLGHIEGEISSNYAIQRRGGLICLPCAVKAEIADLRKRRPTIAYLSGDGRRVTTWTGATLGCVVVSRPCALSRVSFWHDRRSFRSVRVVDVHGAEWAGRGSPGVAIKLRPVGGGK